MHFRIGVLLLTAFVAAKIGNWRKITHLLVRYSTIQFCFSAAAQTNRDKPIVCCWDYQEVIRYSNRCLMQVRTCDYDPSKPLNCKRCIDPPFCWCKEGYFKNSFGQCVLKEDCDNDGPEVYEELKPIECKAPNEKLYSVHDPSVNRWCPHLRKNHHSSDTSSSSSSSSSGCSPNKYTSTVVANTFVYCDGSTAQHSTPRRLITLNVCDCMKGFYRNACRQCVELEKCKRKCSVHLDDPCSDPKAIRQKCHRQCETLTCRHVINHTKPKCRSSEKCQKNVCVCQPGTALNDCNQCVPIKKCLARTACRCSDKPCIGQFEQPRCFNSCNERTCYYHDIRHLVRCASWCTYGCDCINNYWRNSLGECNTYIHCP